MGRKGRNTERYVLLDLGTRFAVGKLVRSNPQFITLEILKVGRDFQPSYHRGNVSRIVNVGRSTAEVLGKFSSPPVTVLNGGKTVGS